MPVHETNVSVDKIHQWMDKGLSIHLTCYYHIDEWKERERANQSCSAAKFQPVAPLNHVVLVAWFQ